MSSLLNEETLASDDKLPKRQQEYSDHGCLCQTFSANFTKVTDINGQGFVIKDKPFHIVFNYQFYSKLLCLIFYRPNSVVIAFPGHLTRLLKSHIIGDVATSLKYSHSDN